MAPTDDPEARGPGSGAADTPAAPRGSRGGRAALVTVDQALSSITNLLAVLWVAHAVSAAQFGSFALLMLVYAFAMGPVHALVSMRVLVHPDDADHRPRAVLGSVAVLGLAGGVLCVGVGAVQTAAGWASGPLMLTLGIALPALMLHDVGRWIAVARSEPAGAVLLDATWLVALVASFAMLEVLDRVSLVAMTVAWAGSGVLASLWLVGRYGPLRPAELSLHWLMERWDQSWRLLVSNVVAAGGALLGAALIALVSSPVAVAAVRAAILLGRPTAAVQAAVASSAAADVAREQPDNRGLLHAQRRTMLVAAAVAVVNLVVLIFLPEAVGRAVLGNVWPVVSPLILPIALITVVAAAQAGVRGSLMGRRRFQIVMITEIVGAVTVLSALVVGASLGGAEGAVWALVVGQTLASACWWTALVWHLRRYPSGVTDGVS